MPRTAPTHLAQSAHTPQTSPTGEMSLWTQPMDGTEIIVVRHGQTVSRHAAAQTLQKHPYHPRLSIIFLIPCVDRSGT